MLRLFRPLVLATTWKETLHLQIDLPLGTARAELPEVHLHRLTYGSEVHPLHGHAEEVDVDLIRASVQLSQGEALRPILRRTQR